MVDVFKLADAFIEHVLKTHRDQVALIGYYGSYATGTATPQSDLDLIYVPDNMESTQNLYNSFVIDGRPYEFWPISWERLERIAKAQEHWPVSAGLLMNLKILHHRSEEDLDRIKALKTITLELQTPEKKTEMVEKALNGFTLVLNNLGKLRLEVKKGHLTGVRWSGWEVVTSCVECLALANQTYFNKGWGSNYEELLKLKERPRELDEYIVDITTSDDPSEVLRISEQLAYETREIILESQEKPITTFGYGLCPAAVTIAKILESEFIK